MATAIQVILTEDSEAGKAGELKKVRPGYARNFLLTKGLAVIADAVNLTAYQEKKAELEKAAQARREKAEANKEDIGEDTIVELVAKAGESGKLFGAITKEKIATAVSEQLKIELTKENVQITAPIKTTGEHKIKLDLGSNVKTEISIKVIAEKN